MRANRLFHVSEDPAIGVFSPRPVPSLDAGVEGDAVWAIDEEHLPNYLLPRDCSLYLYELPVDGFELADRNAGYFISRTSVLPASCSKIENSIAELQRRNIEVRILPNLWDLRDQVVDSTLEYSIIRFRNAKPR